MALPKEYFAWGGFAEGNLVWRQIDDKFAGENLRMSPAIFKTRREAREQFEDVRRVRISLPSP